jgi:hypothetical protein
VITHIDLSSVLHRSVCELYSNLVTRPTGAAVRAEIEQQLAGSRGRTVTVIDFANVGLLDYSCADEVVAKLLLRFTGSSAVADAYFVFRGMDESHLDAVEPVLERHGLALVIQLDDGAARLIGEVSDLEAAAWRAAWRRGGACAEDVAIAVGVEAMLALSVLDGLCARRVMMRDELAYFPLGVRT